MCVRQVNFVSVEQWKISHRAAPNQSQWANRWSAQYGIRDNWRDLFFLMIHLEFKGQDHQF